MANLYSCDHSRDADAYVTHEGRNCPLCTAYEKIDGLEKDVERLEEELETAQNG